MASPQTVGAQTMSRRRVDRQLKAEQCISELLAVCRESALDTTEIQQKLTPLFRKFQPINGDSSSRIRWYLQRLVMVVLSVAGLCALCSLPAVADYLRIQSRLALIKIRPYWDWESSPYRTCLLRNPMYTGDKATVNDESCQVCEGVDSFDQVTNLSRLDALRHYLQQERPVIVDDGMLNWPAFVTEGFNRSHLMQTLDADVVAGRPFCELKTNLRARNDISVLFDKMRRPDVQKWFAQWENCDKSAAKSLRTLYRRPYFLPVIIDNTDSNWVLISSNYTGKLFKPLPVYGDVNWMAQVYGTTTVRFVPKSICVSYCTEMTTVLQPGEMVMFTDYAWDFEYLPGMGTENLAIGAVGYWN